MLKKGLKMKKKYEEKTNSEKRKKTKSLETEAETLKAEVLDFQNLRENMVLLGCVIEIRTNYLLISLPGCLVGNVPLGNISKRYTELIINSSEVENEAEVDLASIVEVGAVYPCRVLKVTYKENVRKPSILLSMDPQDVNAELRLQSLYLKMVLHAAVQSIEDHGYVMDIGITGAQGFLPFTAANGIKNLKLGQVIPTSVRKLPSHKKGTVVWLSKLSFNETLPEIEDDSMQLTSILPGAYVTAYITEIRHPFMYMKCMNFDACANMMSVGSSNQNLSEATKVSGTVLYVHPVSHMIYLLLGPKPTPDTFKKLFRLKKFDLVTNLRYQYFWHHRLLFRMHKGAMGFVKKGELPERGSLSQDSLSKNPVVPKARVVFLHYMDNLVQLSLNESVINQEIIKPEDVQIGDIYEGTVNKHIEKGMFVTICPGFSGLVRNVFLSDAFVTMPEKLHPVGTKVKCRVLSMHETSFDLTSKESLLKIPASDLLMAYEQVQKDNSYKGVIVQKTTTHLLVLFCNDVKGVVPSEEIPESSLFFVGQTVSCRVLKCDPIKKRLKLSLMGDIPSTKTQSQTNKSPKKDCNTNLEEGKLDPRKTHKAIIKSVTGRQLNIVLNGGMRGRVHVTEIGHIKEGCMPLKDYKINQCIKVHVLGAYDCKSGNFLEISHRRKQRFLECSIEFPPPAALHKELLPGMDVTGYVKNACSTSATLWLSPVQTAILDYLHYSENPKVLRKLKKTMKPGLAVNANVFEVVRKSKDNDSFYDIQLSKLGNQVIRVGTNVVGLVQISCPEKGLVLKLSHGHHGSVSLSDLQDVSTSVNGILTKCRKLRFILCHVLEVNHSTKFCVLSLRKSRLYSLKYTETKDVHPEITASDLEQGSQVQGFVKMAHSDHLIVNFGRMLDGWVPLHKCEIYGCTLCKHMKNVLEKYPPGEAIEVVVESTSASKNLYLLSFPELSGLGLSENSRLTVAEDINWDDV